MFDLAVLAIGAILNYGANILSEATKEKSSGSYSKGGAQIMTSLKD